MAKLFFESITKFGLLDKVEAITVDNANVNNKFFDEIAVLMDNGGHDFDKILNHYRCLAHILNLGVQDMSKLLKFRPPDEDDENSDESDVETDNESDDEYDDLEPKVENSVTDLLTKVRQVCKKLKFCGGISSSLEEFCKPFRIPFVKPTLDCTTRWNSSLKMLEYFRRLKLAIKVLCSSNPEMQNFQLLDVEWEAIDRIVSYLEIFKQVSDLLSMEKHPTLPVAVLAINILIDQVEKNVRDLDEKEDRSLLDEILSSAHS